MGDDQRGAADGNLTEFPQDANPYDEQYADWTYGDHGAVPGGFVAGSRHDGNMEAYPLQVLDAMGQSGHYLTPPLALNVASQGAYDPRQWSWASAQTTAWVDNQAPGVALEPSSSSTDATPYGYRSGYFVSNNAIPTAYQSSLASTSPWPTTASSSLSPTPSSQQQSQDWTATATTASGDSSGKAPPKKKRGRPRLYEDDGTEVPKRTPGRPPMYSSTSSSSISSLKAAPTAASAAVSTATASSVSVVPSTSRSRQSSKDEDPKQSSIRARNKAAATRYRQKTQAAIAEMEAEEREASLKRQALLECAGQLKEEVFQLKNEVLRHADCGCPLIEGYLSNAAQQAAMSLGETAAISQGMGGMSLAGQGAGDARVMHLEECSMVFGDGGYFEGAYVEGWQGLGADRVDGQGIDGQSCDSQGVDGQGVNVDEGG